MPHRLLRTAALLALGLAAGPARAADFDGPYPPRPDLEEGYGQRPPPPPEPVLRGPRFSAGPRFVPPPDACRTFVKRRIDAYGEPVIRRVRVCDEPDDLGPPRIDAPPVPPADIPHRRWDGPRW